MTKRLPATGALAFHFAETGFNTWFSPVKRKMAVILAADVAGYSSLVGQDEEDTLSRLENYRAVFADFVGRFSGRIFNTAGDAILAEFSSAVDAVRCAIDTQESIRTRNLAYPPSRQMHFRIGITIGDIVQREGDLLGEGVNIAARLEGIAPVGGICVSRSVYEAVANKISLKFLDAGEQQLKNLPDPVHAYVVTPGQPAGRTGRLLPTVSRPYSVAILAAGVGALLVGAYTLGTLRVDKRQDSTNEVTADASAPAVPQTAAAVSDKIASEPASQPVPAKDSASVLTAAKSENLADTEADSSGQQEEAESSGTDGEKCADVDHEGPAIAACTRLLKQDGLSRSDKALYLSNRGAAHLNRGEYDIAIDDLNRSLRLVPDDALANYNRGATYFYKGEYETALADLQKAVRFDPKHESTQYYLGRTLHELGRNEEAVTHLTKAIASDPNNEHYFRYRADSILDKGDYRRAVADYDEAIQLAPKYGEAFRGRGIAWLNDGDFEKAIDDLNRALEIDPADWFARSVRGSVHAKAGRYDEAVKDETEALRIEPDNADVLNRRADVLLKSGQFDAALVDVNRALEIDPQFAIAITTRGEIYEKLRRNADAISEFKRALALDNSIDDAKAGLERLDPRSLSALTQENADQAGTKTCAKYLPLIGKVVWLPCND